MDIWTALADERRATADRLEGLTPEQWQVRTLCEAWDVHGMAAHLAVPLDFSVAEMLTTLVRARGNPDRLSVLMAERRAQLTGAELVALLREKATSRKAPPVVGAMGPYTDTLVHLQDILIPLALTDDRPAERWLPSLDFLVSRKARVGFVSERLPAVRLVADDVEWSHGEGPEVAGPAAALALAIMRRTPRLDEMRGPGAETMRAWAMRGM